MPTGIYNNRVQVLIQNVIQNDIGEAEEVFTPGHFLWCQISEDNPRRVVEAGAMQTGIDGTISIRNYPDISTLDMLRDCYGRVWKIEGRTNGNNEIILRCYTDDSLVDWIEETSD